MSTLSDEAAPLVLPEENPAESMVSRLRALPGLFVVLALFALVLVPVAIQEHISSMRAELTAIDEPAEDLIDEIQYLLARQTSALRGYLISRDPEYLGQYRTLAAREMTLYLELDNLGERMTPEVAADIAELRTLSRSWHERLASGNIERSGATAEAALVVLEQEVYRQTLDAASTAMLSIRNHTRQREAAIGSVERTVRILYLVLLLLASAATYTVIGLNSKIREFAEAADARRLEAERAMRQTERVVAARADLIRGFTHDVKNPLGVADGYAEILEEGIRGELSETQLDTIARIRTSIHGAIEIINELLDLSRLEGGGLQLSRQKTDIALLVQGVVQQHTGQAGAAGLELKMLPPPRSLTSVEAYTDQDRVRQILQNLVSNAIKYTPSPGRISVEIDQPASQTNGSWIRLSVIDTGRGIPAEEQDRIFNEFHRMPGSSGSGHGLGLAISRRIARLLGGDVTVRSVYGEGATFMLWLPVRGEEESALPAEQTAAEA